jgi:hypothetical protein
MENNNQEILQKLMENDTTNTNNKEEEQISISTTRISSIKYRFYTVILLALIIV